MCIFHKGLRGKRAVSSSSVLGDNLKGLKSAIPHEIMHSTVAAINDKL